MEGLSGTFTGATGATFTWENVRTMGTGLPCCLTPWRNARNIPGKLSETVHGARFAEVNAAVGCSVAEMGTRHAHSWMGMYRHEFDTAI